MSSYDGSFGSGSPRETNPAGFPEPGMPSSPSSMAMPMASLPSPSYDPRIYDSPSMPSPVTGHYGVHDIGIKKSVQSILQPEPRIVVVEPIGLPEVGFPSSVVTSPVSIFTDSASPLHRHEQSWSPISECSGPHPTVDGSLRHQNSSSEFSYASSQAVFHSHDHHLSASRPHAEPSFSSSQDHSEFHTSDSVSQPNLDAANVSSETGLGSRGLPNSPLAGKHKDTPTLQQGRRRQSPPPQAHLPAASSGRPGPHEVSSHGQKKPKKNKQGKGKGGCIIM